MSRASASPVHKRPRAPRLMEYYFFHLEKYFPVVLREGRLEDKMFRRMVQNAVARRENQYL